MDLITIALAKKAGASGGASGDPGILTKLENSVKEVQKKVDTNSTKLTDIENSVTPLLPLAEGAILAIKMGDNTKEAIKPTDNVLILPLAAEEVPGLVKSTPTNSENSINKISVNSDGTMEVNSISADKIVGSIEIENISSDKLVAGKDILIFNSNYKDYFNT